MPTRRRLLLFGLPAVVVAAVLATWLLWPHPTAITRQNAARIQIGMTLAEVEAILGGPARDEATGPIVYEAAAGRVAHGGPAGALKVWQSDTVQAAVIFRDGGVIQSRALPVRRADEPFLDRLRRWLGL